LKRLYPYIDGIQRQPPTYLKRFFKVTPEDLNNPFFSHLPRWKLTQKLKAFYPTKRAPKSGHIAVRENCGRATGLLREHESFQSGRIPRGGFADAPATFYRRRVIAWRWRTQSKKVSIPGLSSCRVRCETFAGAEDESFEREVSVAAGGNRLIPESVRRRYKQPYRAPDGCSFFGPKAGCVDDILSPEHIKRNGIFDSKAVTQLVRKFRSGTETSAADNMALVGVLSTEPFSIILSIGAVAPRKSHFRSDLNGASSSTQ